MKNWNQRIAALRWRASHHHVHLETDDADGARGTEGGSDAPGKGDRIGQRVSRDDRFATVGRSAAKPSLEDHIVQVAPQKEDFAGGAVEQVAKGATEDRKVESVEGVVGGR